MAITVKVLADSLAPCGKRLTTMEWKYPRSIHAEIMTHRMLSKNSASSRAIPTEKLIQMVVDDPFIPEHIGANQAGMQAGEELREDKRQWAIDTWLKARDSAVAHARHLLSYGVHKQVVNRLVEPWMWITIIVSATEWENVWGLRCHPAAEPHFQKLAYMARDAMAASTPEEMPLGGWHTPLYGSTRTGGAGEDEAAILALAMQKEPNDTQRATDYATELMKKISVGRCARVSYLTHDGKREVEKDIELHDRMAVQQPLHASPTEHVAQALAEPIRSGNFIGWRQYRKTLPNENIGAVLP